MHKFKLPVVFAYIVAGMLIGPYGFKLIKKVNEVEALAEVGVALLMFVKGVELNLSKLKTIWKVSIIGSTIQYAKECNPDIFIISRAFDREESHEWERIGANRTTIPHLAEAVEMLKEIRERLSL